MSDSNNAGLSNPMHAPSPLLRCDAVDNRGWSLMRRIDDVPSLKVAKALCRMNIKTLTCHNVYNYGASLQAYALARYLEDLGHVVEVIDYVPEYLVHYPSWGRVSPRFDKPGLRQAYCLAKLPSRGAAFLLSKRKRAFDRFTDEYLPLTDNHYSTCEELREARLVADAFIVGSDQIWNTQFQNGRDPAFFLRFVDASAKRIAYAASIAASGIGREHEARFARWLVDFDFISVREKNATGMLKDIGISSVSHVLDPVFLLGEEHWEGLQPKPHPTEPYVLYYGFDGDHIAEKAAFEFAHANCCKLHSLSKSKYCDRGFWDTGPLSLVSLVRQARYVITNSFHATAFSVLFRKDFCTFRRAGDLNSRIVDLLSCLGLGNRMLDPESFDMQAIDYSFVDATLQELKRASEVFLAEALSEP